MPWGEASGEQAGVVLRVFKKRGLNTGVWEELVHGGDPQGTRVGGRDLCS